MKNICLFLLHLVVLVNSANAVIDHGKEEITDLPNLPSSAAPLEERLQMAGFNFEKEELYRKFSATFRSFASP